MIIQSTSIYQDYQSLMYEAETVRKIAESIDILSEANVIVEGEKWDNFKDKVKTLWEKFINWVSEHIITPIKNVISNFKLSKIKSLVSSAIDKVRKIKNRIKYGSEPENDFDELDDENAPEYVEEADQISMYTIPCIKIYHSDDNSGPTEKGTIMRRNKIFSTIYDEVEELTLPYLNASRQVSSYLNVKAADESDIEITRVKKAIVDANNVIKDIELPYKLTIKLDTFHSYVNYNNIDSAIKYLQNAQEVYEIVEKTLKKTNEYINNITRRIFEVKKVSEKHISERLIAAKGTLISTFIKKTTQALSECMKVIAFLKGYGHSIESKILSVNKIIDDEFNKLFAAS